MGRAAAVHAVADGVGQLDPAGAGGALLIERARDARGGDDGAGAGQHQRHPLALEPALRDEERALGVVERGRVDDVDGRIEIGGDVELGDQLVPLAAARSAVTSSSMLAQRRAGSERSARSTTSSNACGSCAYTLGGGGSGGGRTPVTIWYKSAPSAKTSPARVCSKREPDRRAMPKLTSLTA